MPSMPGAFSDVPNQPSYEIRTPDQGPPTGPSAYYPPPTTNEAMRAPYPPGDYSMGGYAGQKPQEHQRHDRHDQLARRHEDVYSDDESDQRSNADPIPPLPSRHDSQSSYTRGAVYPDERSNSQPASASDHYQYPPPTTAGAAQPQYAGNHYHSQPAYQYAPPPEQIAYTAKPQTKQPPVQYSHEPHGQHRQHRQELPRKYSDSSYLQDERIVDITPGAPDRNHDRHLDHDHDRFFAQDHDRHLDRDHNRYLDRDHDRDLGRDRKPSTSQSYQLSVGNRTANTYAPPSPGLGAHMDRLSVGGNHSSHGNMSGGMPPPSPLLEAYHGTYQSISPMPTAMRLNDDDLDDLPPLDYPVSRVKHDRSSIHEKEKLSHDKEKKRVKLYDPEADARLLAAALSSHKVDGDAVCDVLPPLSHDQIWELRKEYKKQVKIQGKGINLSKHLKMKLTGSFGKVAYVTALGRWESEGNWANFFYQSHASRRELLIESLMGRTNAEIRSIKDEFKDKRYNDDLVRCMEKELKMDKFRSAVLMALEGRRQEEQDVYPQEYRDRDVELLDRSVRAREGGESAMLEIVVRRSDAHLREILRQYERMTGENFARVALKKSNNLVGEVIAHILNSVINKPARDSLLLRHAIKDIAARNKDDELRYELLISRLVRLHWDRLHLARVKKEYRDRYGKHLEEDLEDATKGDFREFVCELCQVQGPNK